MMTVVLIYSCLFQVYADSSVLDKSGDNLSFDVDYNDSVSNAIIKKTNDSREKFLETGRAKKLKINIRKINNSQYEACGLISLEGKDKKFKMTGELKNIELASGKVGKIGTLEGKVEDEVIAMTLHMLPKESKLFSYVTVGTVSKNSNPQIFTYGNMFDEMNELVKEYFKKSKKENDNLKSDVDSNLVAGYHGSFNESELGDVRDFNTTYRSLGYSYGTTYDGEDIKLASVSFYTPKKTRANYVYKMYVKVNGSTENARRYVMNSTNAIPGVMILTNSKGTCKIYTNDENLELKEMSPGNDRWSVSIPIPFYAGGNFGFLPWNINIYFSNIKAKLSRSPGKHLDNIATWYHNHSSDIEWGSDGPIKVKKGYAGSVSAIYFDNQGYTRYCTTYATGSVRYNYSSLVGTTEYSGHIIADLPVVEAETTIVPSNEN